MCQWLENAQIEVRGSSIESVFFKAEGLRLFKCSGAGLLASVKQDVSELLSSPTQYLSSVSDYFNAFMINKRAKHYGVSEPSDAFIKNFLQVLDKDWIDNFNAEQFGLKKQGSTQGVTFDSIRLIEMMASVVKDKNLGQRAQAKVTKALNMLFTQAASTSADANSDRQIFFVAPKGAYDPQKFDLTQVNLHTLSALIEARKVIKL